MSNFRKMKLVLAAVMLPLVFFCSQAFGQASSSLSGTVMDPTQAVLPGATVTAVNTETGVKTNTTANSAGIYTFPSIQPGLYKVTAEMPGFQTLTKTDVKLGANMNARLNFELPVAGVATQIEITSSAQDMILEAGSSTGSVLQNEHVVELPLINNDVLDLVNVMGGVVKPEDTVFGNSNQTFAGVPGSQVNVARDGVSVNEVRYVSGISAASRLNPEMIGEFKLVLSSVDAELGRGGGQVQVVTKSGANAFHGSGVWDVQNSALDANEWSNNRRGIEPNWRNLNEYTISASGPIIKNKTFFFAMWNQALPRSRSVITSSVLTPCARKGIYRYFDGWVNGTGYLAPTVATGTLPSRAVVDQQGNPLATGTTPTGDPSELRYYSVLGQLTPESMAQLAADPYNCSQYLPDGLSVTGNNGLEPDSAWDANRVAFDQSGFIQRFNGIMPLPNDYSIGDGLNTAGHRWVRTSKGADNSFGMGQDNARKQLTVKIDHNLNMSHRLSGSLMYERNISDDSEAVWPDGYGGSLERYPLQISSSLTSTLKPTLLNEFRFGFTRSLTHTYDPMNSSRTGKEMTELLHYLMPTKGFPNYDGFPLIVSPGTGQFSFAAGTSHPMGGRGAVVGVMGGEDQRKTFADTITWTKGAHSIKAGAEVRFQSSEQESNGNNWNVLTYPIITGGQNFYTPAAGIGTNWLGMTGLDQAGFSSASGTYAGAYGLLNYMAGSIGSISQYYYVNSPTDTSWNDPTKGELIRKVTMRQREFSMFVKDDWKVTPSLTLNLGLRYEYYGVPWLDSGMTLAIKDGFLKAFGQSNDFSDWMPADPQFDASRPLMALEFVGPNSPNPSKTYLNKDLNNIGPAVGFAWQLPWLGKGKTTIRGGYQLSYLQMTTLDPNSGVGPAIANAPGTNYTHTFSSNGDALTGYMDLANVAKYVPTAQFLNPSIQPLMPRPIDDRTAYLTVYDPDTRTPYIQSLNLSVTRNIGSALTVDVRYIGTLSRKGISGINLNSANFINNGLLEAFTVARAGGEHPLLDEIIKPNTLVTGYGGAEALRRATTGSINANLAAGNFAAVANTLATTNGSMFVFGTAGGVLRASGAPENFIYANPQFAAVTLNGNNNFSNYHSMQAQVTMRPKRGLNFQATYTWSRNLGLNGATDVLDRHADYGVLGSNRSHAFTSQGTYVLPLGANGFLFRDTSGIWKKLIEGWQLSWIGTINSGVPSSITGTNSMWGGTGTDLVRPDLFDTKGGHVEWAPGEAEGWYYGKNRYMRVPDPQCQSVAAGLRTTCEQNLGALAIVDHIDAEGNLVAGPIVFQHAQPGTRGNFLANQLTSIGRWNLDTAMGKSFEFAEGKSITLRVDAQNIFNHPIPSGTDVSAYNGRNYSPSAPSFNINSNSTPFGRIASKAGHRVFSAKIRLNF